MSCPNCGKNTLVNVGKDPLGGPTQFHCYECNYHGDGSTINDSSRQTTIVCPECGGKLRIIGHNVNNNHDFIDTQCIKCKTIIQVVLAMPYTRSENNSFMEHLLPFRRICQDSGKVNLQIFDTSNESKTEENKDDS